MDKLARSQIAQPQTQPRQCRVGVVLEPAALRLHDLLDRARPVHAKDHVEFGCGAEFCRGAKGQQMYEQVAKTIRGVASPRP